MKKGYITIAGKDFAPMLVGFGECCLNCDVKQKFCSCQCHELEDSEEENVALKEVKHGKEPTVFGKLLGKVKKVFKPIETDLPI